MLGGFPRYLAETLRGSLVWNAAVEAHEGGALVGGSSAGAMVLCAKYYDPSSDSIQPGLNVLPRCCVIPHHDRSGARWIARLSKELAGMTLLGIDEQTGMIEDSSGAWSVHGAGSVTVYQGTQPEVHTSGSIFRLDLSAAGPG
jgi:cyanophycinase-like exopeptidase